MGSPILSNAFFYLSWFRKGHSLSKRLTGIITVKINPFVNMAIL
ncbi:Uncharacterised protein [Niallia circulans]|jgi:hypothetical protein|nr:Uncharacterised protein [Niallia circulans]